ncbi:MAG TPA: RluA family pseudouridine synthase, partial [Vicinamibacteria bacterium]|nr:RluA family pseudouridine synthase [Vicinamibacteria bacterium]
LRHPDLSRRRARDVIEKGQVDVGGRTVIEPGHLLEPGEAVAWDPNRRARSRVRCSVPFLHEDSELVVVDKPAGLLAVPTSPGAREDTALGRVQDYVAHRRPRRPYVGAVHRLDRDTSGALAFALSPGVRATLRSMFRAHRMERRYAALVEGSPPEEEGAVDLPIHEGYQAGRRRLSRPGEPSLPARTRWRVVERFAGAALLEVELETGRQHQIRLHLAHLGLPVLGDPVYRPPGRRPPVAVPRQMLHARRLAFAHPTTGAPVVAQSPLPADVRKALSLLRARTARVPG